MKYGSAINIDREALTSLMALRLRTKDNYIRFSKLGKQSKLHSVSYSCRTWEWK